MLLLYIQTAGSTTGQRLSPDLVNVLFPHFFCSRKWSKDGVTPPCFRFHGRTRLTFADDARLLQLSAPGLLGHRDDRVSGIIPVAIYAFLVSRQGEFRRSIPSP